MKDREAWIVPVSPASEEHIWTVQEVLLTGICNVPCVFMLTRDFCSFACF